MRTALAGLLFACQALSPVLGAQPRLVIDLRVTIDGVKPGGGTLRIALHDEATFSDARANPVRHQEFPDVAGDMSIAFDRLPPGSYAVKAFQDLNNNGRLDPGEPQGVSNAAPPNDFDKASLLLMPGANTAVVHLR
jgi:uncharacterized protein (DUF2141 family)